MKRIRVLYIGTVRTAYWLRYSSGGQFSWFR